MNEMLKHQAPGMSPTGLEQPHLQARLTPKTPGQKIWSQLTLKRTQKPLARLTPKETAPRV